MTESPRSRSFLELTKPRITLMVVLTTATGYFLALDGGGLQPLLLLATLTGTGLVASGAAVLNQAVEHRRDARMRRTARRPIPSGRVSTGAATIFGLALAAVGTGVLAAGANVLTALLGFGTLLAYVAVYTPLKRWSSLATLVGAVPGAVPPMMGVTAVKNEVDLLAWVLFGILFLWQMPHFLAIAWLYRSDYERGGFPMLPVADPRPTRTALQMVLYSGALLPVSLLPTVLGVSGLPYLVGAFLLGAIFLAGSVAFGLTRDNKAARRLLLISVAYLPLVLILMVVDRV